jgi:uncharacterized protein YkwD
MSMQRAPRHRAASGAQNRRRRLGTANENRALIAAASTVFFALLLLALVTLPGHAGSTAAPTDFLPSLDNASTFPDAALPATATIVPPSSSTRASGKHPSQAPTKAPALTKQAPTPSGRSSSGRTTQPAGLSASPHPQSPTTASLPDAAQVAQAVFDSINNSRRAAGVRPLKWSSHLHDSAHEHNLAMARANTLSHQLPGEDSLGDRETAAGVAFWWWAAENIADSSSLTTQSALGLEAGMVNEQAPNDGHRKNILASNADVVGVDVLFDATHNMLWLTEDFAQTSLL